jgi:hypothetical protein
VSEWRQVPGFGRYRVSDEGGMLNAHGRPMKLEKLNGYLTVKAWSDEGRRIRVGVHQLVALAFVGPRPSPKHECAHSDGDRLNNTPSNLRWATPRENTDDSVRHGTRVRAPAGEKHPMARLTAEQAASIRARYTSEVGKADQLAAEFGISKSQVRHIAYGRNWSHA